MKTLRRAVSVNFKRRSYLRDILNTNKNKITDLETSSDLSIPLLTDFGVLMEELLYQHFFWLASFTL